MVNIINPYRFGAAGGSSGYLDDTASSNHTISGDDGEIATLDADTYDGIVRTNSYHSGTGKYYAEMVPTDIHTTQSRMGILTDDCDCENDSFGYNNYSWCYFQAGAWAHDSTVIGNGRNTFFEDDVVMIAVDIGAGKVWWSRRGIAFLWDYPTYTDSDITNATEIFLGCAMGTTNNQWEVRLKSAEFTYTIPSGYSAWLAT